MLMRVALTEFDRDGYVLQSQTVMVESVQALNDYVERHRLQNAVTVIAMKSCIQGADVYRFEMGQGKEAR